MYEAGRIVGGKYRLDTLIGQGGMGSVWRARHLTLDRTAAIKFIHVSGPNADRLTARFLREARAAVSVRHRMVVDIFDFGTGEDGQPFMVMEYLEGQSLASRLSNGSPLPLAELFTIVERALSGLAAVHGAGLVHRDLKPENVYLVQDDDGWFPKLLDFGISKSTASSDSDRRGISVEGIVGTPHYMAPEQARGIRDLDARADIYAMGAILYEALTGRLPFDSENVGDLLILIAMSTPPAIEELRPEIGEPIAKVVRTAMAHERDARFPTAKAMRAALLEAVRESPQIAELETPGQQPRKFGSKFVTADSGREVIDRISGIDRANRSTAAPERRRTMWIAAAALAGIGLLAGAAWWMQRGGPSPAHGEPAAARQAPITPAAPAPEPEPEPATPTPRSDPAPAPIVAAPPAAATPATPPVEPEKARSRRSREDGARQTKGGTRVIREADF